MRCSDFLTNYSDFRDRAMDDPVLQRRLIEHLSQCGRCARYHDVIERGVLRLRATDPVQPSRGFRSALRERLAHLGPGVPPLFPVPAQFVGSLILAAALATLIIASLTDTHRELEPLSPPGRPLPMVRASPSPPFVTFADLAAPATFGYSPAYGVSQPEFSFQSYVTSSDTVDHD